MDEARKNLVLIVDDEEQNLKVMSRLLDRHGYAFQTAKNGGEAFAKVKEISPDLIFLDVMMPGPDGYEVRLTLEELGKTNEKLKEAYLDTVRRLTIVSEYRDEAATPHIRRTGRTMPGHFDPASLSRVCRVV